MRVVTSLENRPSKVLDALREVLMSGAYAEGKFSLAAEAMVAKTYGPYATLFNSCGSALYVVFKYLVSCGFKGALVQNNTFFASGAMAREAGMDVALVDSRSDCPSMSLESLKHAHHITGHRVVVLTHVGGWVAKDYAAIAEYCVANGLFLLEDCAHAYGLPEVGKYGDASCWSFYPTKALPIGEGGALTTPSTPLMEYAREFRQYGKIKVGNMISYTKGMNLRISEWDAAVLTVQLDALQEILAARRRDAEALQSVAPCMLTGVSNYYKYPVKTHSAGGLRTVGKVYCRTDQLDVSLAKYGVERPVSLTNSFEWAMAHACLPVGEGLYDCKTHDGIRAMLRIS
jgi:perosamine synthetase